MRHAVAFGVLLGGGFAFGWYSDATTDRLLEQTYDCSARCEARCEAERADDDDVGITLGLDRAGCSDCAADCR